MSTPLRVLIVEDSEEDTLLIVRELKRGGFDPIHERVETAETMKAALSTKTWDLILADYSMPHFSGLEALKLLKASGLDLPFIIVSGSIGEDVAVEVMKSGANDYLMKSNLKRLIPAIEQELREAEVGRKLKHSEKALQEAEKRYRQVVENATEIIYAVDEKGNFTYANPAGLKVTGYSLEELQQFNYLDLVISEHRERVAEIYINQFRQRIPTTHVEFPFFGKAGEVIWFSQNSTLVMEGDRIVGFHIIARDITERKQAEERLQERERYFRTLMYTLHEDIVVIDRDYRITDVNNTFLITTGNSREQVIGKHCYEISHGNAEPCDRHGERCLLGEVFETGKSRNCKHVHMRGDGSKVHVDILLSPLKDDSGSVTHVVEAIRDVSDLIQAYEALQESEEKYRLLVENANEAIFVIQDGMLRFFNIKNIELIGYSKEELTSTPFINFVHPDDREATLRRHLKRIRGEELPGVNVFRVIDKAGNIKWAEVNAVLISWEGMPATLNFLNDITERKRAEDSLRESVEALRAFLNANPEVSFLMDAKGTVLVANESLFKRFGKSSEEIIGSCLYDLFPEDVAKQRKSHFDEVFRTGKPVHFEDVRMDRNYETFVHPVFDKEGNVAEVAILGFDITERKKAEEGLKQAEKKYRNIFENAIEGIFQATPAGRYISTNPALASMYGFESPEELINTITDIAHQVYVNPDDRSELFRLLQEKGVVHNFETQVYRKDRKVIWISLNVRYVCDSQGRFLYYEGFVEDITERRRTEQERLNLEEQLRQSQKMEAIGRLAGGIAHDFNNLLTVIKGYSELSLMELKEGDPLRGNIEEIQKGSQRAADLTHHLLAFSRRQVMEMRVLDLNTLLRDMDKMLRRVIGEDIELVTHLSDDLGSVKIDPGQIEQVVMNLAVNARDAMPSGGKLTIETANVELDETYARSHLAVKPGPYVMLSMSDTGVGMTPKVRERVFEPFFTTKEKDKGTGLGLSTVYGIVKQSGGNIWVYSELGKGTTFKIYLPRVDEPLEEIRKEVLKDELPSGNETVLVVEDAEEVRKLILKILERQGYRILEASNGDDALLLHERHGCRIDLILVDVVMPGMSGSELAKRLMSLYPKMKVLYMSGYTDNAIVHHGVLEKGVNYIQKPFTMDGLTRKVREVLDKDSEPAG